MNRIRKRVVAIALGRVGERAGDEWCGTFCVAVLRDAGLSFPRLNNPQGKSLTLLLDKIDRAEPGDIVRYDNGHCAVVVAHSSRAICLIGGSRTVDMTVRALGEWSMPATYYSIGELIRQYEMSGADTPEDVL